MNFEVTLVGRHFTIVLAVLTFLFAHLLSEGAAQSLCSDSSCCQTCCSDADSVLGSGFSASKCNDGCNSNTCTGNAAAIASCDLGTEFVEASGLVKFASNPLQLCCVGTGLLSGDAAVNDQVCNPTTSPTKSPTRATNLPTKSPTKAPTKTPTKAPTKTPTKAPTKSPTRAPTKNPTRATNIPSKSPTRGTIFPSTSPTNFPSRSPTKAPTSSLIKVTTSPSKNPTKDATRNPSLDSTTLTPTIGPNVPPLGPSVTPENSNPNFFDGKGMVFVIAGGSGVLVLTMVGCLVLIRQRRLSKRRNAPSKTLSKLGRPKGDGNDSRGLEYANLDVDIAPFAQQVAFPSAPLEINSGAVVKAPKVISSETIAPASLGTVPFTVGKAKKVQDEVNNDLTPKVNPRMTNDRASLSSVATNYLEYAVKSPFRKSIFRPSTQYINNQQQKKQTKGPRKTRRTTTNAPTEEVELKDDEL